MRSTVMRGAAAVALAIVVAVSTAPASSADEGHFVDWGSKRLALGDTGRFEVDFFPGDAPFLRVQADGELEGGIELNEFDGIGEDHPIHTDGWQAWAESLYDTIEADRREGCDPNYRLDRDPVEPAMFGGVEGVRYGFTGTWSDGRPSERSVLHAAIHDGQLFILGATGLADDSCVPRETEMSLDVFPDLEPVVARIAEHSILPDAGVPAVRRLAGADRYGTAAASATASFGGGTGTAVLTSGTGFADALAANYLAGRLIAPVVLTARDHLPADTADELSALQVTDVVIVGGPAAVSEDVAAELRAGGWRVERIAGADRYETAAAVAAAPDPRGIGSLEPDGPPAAIVATGEAFPDALAAGPVAFGAHLPVLLTPSGHLGEAARAALTDLGIGRVVIAGGSRAVSDHTVAAIEQLGIPTIRVAGADRTETAVAFADLAVDTFGFQTHDVVVARGDRYADALSAGVHAGSRISPLVVTASPEQLGEATEQWLRSLPHEVSTLHVIGGTSAVGDDVVSRAVEAASTR